MQVYWKIDAVEIAAVIANCNIFFFFNDTATTEIYTNLNTLSLTRRSSDLNIKLAAGSPGTQAIGRKLFTR